MCKYVIPKMNGGGVIINMSSVNGLASTRVDSAYSITEDGIMALTRAIAVEYSPMIRCVAIALRDRRH